eukprot:Phypoly_transcript_03079.p1 GENE.Phypoly_transcript_03079~~Phypoly_transcript_03079.p1  ORF type:complete len:801 (+),score=173.70 Phypoly_transcript_03079:95-2497(+)
MSKPVLASCSDTIKWWELPNITPTKEFNPHSKPVTSLCWSANNQALISGSSDGTLSVSFRGAPVISLEGNGMGSINSVTCSSTSKLLASGDENGSVFVWDLKSKDLVKTFRVSQLSQSTSMATCVQFNASDSHIAAGSSDGDVVLYSMTTNQIVANFQIPDYKESGVRDLKYSPFMRHILAVCSDDGGVHMWDTHTRKLHTTFPQQHNAPASAIVFSPANKLLLGSCGLDKKILFYDINEKKVLKVIPTDSPLNCLGFMEDGITLAAGDTKGKILVYDLRAGSTPLHTLQAHTPYPVNAIRFQHLNRSGGANSMSSILPPTPSSTSHATPTTSSHIPSTPSSTFSRIPATPSSTITSSYSSSSIPTPSSVYYSTQSSLPPDSVHLIINGTTKQPTTPTYSDTSDVSAFSPIKGTKGSSAPPAAPPPSSSSLQTQPTQTQLLRDEQHREVLLKAQRVLRQPAPSLSSTKGLQGDDTSKKQGMVEDSTKGKGEKNQGVEEVNKMMRGMNDPHMMKEWDEISKKKTGVEEKGKGEMNGEINKMTRGMSDPYMLSNKRMSDDIPTTLSPPTSTLPSPPHTPSSSSTPTTSLPPHTSTSLTFSSPPAPSPPYSSIPITSIPPFDSTPTYSQPPHSSPIPTSTSLSSVFDRPQTAAPVPMDTTPDSSSLPFTSPSPSMSHPNTIPSQSHSPTQPLTAHTTTSANFTSFSHAHTHTPPSLASPVIPIQDVQWRLMKSVLNESLQEFKASIRQDVLNLHMELIQQFQIQQLEMQNMLEQYVQNSQKELVEEIKALRQENTLLRQRVFY